MRPATPPPTTTALRPKLGPSGRSGGAAAGSRVRVAAMVRAWQPWSVQVLEPWSVQGREGRPCRVWQARVSGCNRVPEAGTIEARPREPIVGTAADEARVSGIPGAPWTSILCTTHGVLVPCVRPVRGAAGKYQNTLLVLVASHANKASKREQTPGALIDRGCKRAEARPERACTSIAAVTSPWSCCF